jgi:alkylation response protein AidB-like acyl-CoA dehydrogenase
LLLSAFSEADGGVDLSEPECQGQLCRVLRILGGADLSLARLFEGHVNAISLVRRYGTRHQVERLAKSVAAGDLSGVWAAEDAAGLALIKQDDSWKLQGRKIFASGAGFVRRPIVTVSSDSGDTMFLLDLSKAGERADLSGWQVLGMQASATGTVELTGLHVGADQQIGKAGDYLRQPFFSAGAWRFCAAQLGAVERLTELYRVELQQRGRGADPYQLERLAHCGAALGTALFWIEEAVRRFADDGLDPEAVVAFVNLTRLVTERSALEVIERVQRGVGLAAFLRPNPIERICRDLSTYLRQPAPDFAMKDAAQAILTGVLVIGAVS